MVQDANFSELGFTGGLSGFVATAERRTAGFSPTGFSWVPPADSRILVDSSRVVGFLGFLDTGRIHRTSPRFRAHRGRVVTTRQPEAPSQQGKPGKRGRMRRKNPTKAVKIRRHTQRPHTPVAMKTGPGQLKISPDPLKIRPQIRRKFRQRGIKLKKKCCGLGV